MSKKEFIWWLLGFVYNKDGLEAFKVAFTEILESL